VSPTGLWSPSSAKADRGEAVKAQAQSSDSDTACDINKLSAGFWPLNCTKGASDNSFSKQRHSNLNTSVFP
jgi:hypothetical protein